MSGDVPGKKRVTVYVPEALAKEIKILAAVLDKKLTDVYVEAAEEYLKKYKDKEII